MQLHIIARGKIGRSPEAELVARYAKRITWPLRLTELPETGGRLPEPQTPLRTVLLDERGRQLGSEEFAEILRGWRDNGVREARFVIGNIPFVSGDTGPFGEFPGPLVISGIISGDLHAAVTKGDTDRLANAPGPSGYDRHSCHDVSPDLANIAMG